MGSQTPFQPQPCAPIERSELNMYCKHQRGGFSAPIFVFSVQFCIQTCRQKGRDMRVPAPIEHERPLGRPKKQPRMGVLQSRAYALTDSEILRNMHRAIREHTQPIPHNSRARREPVPNSLRAMGAQGRRIKAGIIFQRGS